MTVVVVLLVYYISCNTGMNLGNTNQECPHYSTHSNLKFLFFQNETENNKGQQQNQQQQQRQNIYQRRGNNKGGDNRGKQRGNSNKRGNRGAGRGRGGVERPYDSTDKSAGRGNNASSSNSDNRGGRGRGRGRGGRGGNKHNRKNMADKKMSKGMF